MPHKTLFLFMSISALAVSACGGSSDSNTASTPAPAPTTQVETTVAEAVQPVDRGQVLYKRCRTCHTLEQDGRHKVGPNLWGISGAKAGAKEDFKYSAVMAESEIIWTDENLDAYIEKPAAFMPGNRMSFVGIRSPEDRAILIEYLKANTGGTDE